MIGFRAAFAVAVAGFGLSAGTVALPAWAQEVAATTPDAAADAAAPAGLTEDELNVLVARIALYPDDLVALIAAASLFPLQIVEAARFLEQVKEDASLEPKDSWDGSVISLLNYPEIVKMMSEDLEWTQDLGTAIAYQQQDVLVAIQQLRDEAVDKGIIKTDDKMTVTEEEENVIIQSTSEEVVYIPQYEPQMLYEDDYPYEPIGYYEDSYPYYYSPVAPFFAGFWTGAIWGAMVDWGDWGVWGGNWGGDFNINCNNCLNGINGRIRAGDVDWRNVDRSKVSFDRDQFTGANRDNVRDSIRSNDANNIRERATTVKRDREVATRESKRASSDIRQGKHDAARRDGDRTGSIGGGDRQRPAASGGARQKPAASRGGGKKPSTRQASRPKPAARGDSRPRKPSAMGEVRSGKKAQVHSSRGRQSMSGGGSRQRASRGGGGRQSGGGRGGGGRGGGRR